MNANEHPNREEDFDLLALGALEGDERRAVESHVKTCASCAHKLAETAATVHRNSTPNFIALVLAPPESSLQASFPEGLPLYDVSDLARLYPTRSRAREACNRKVAYRNQCAAI